MVEEAFMQKIEKSIFPIVYGEKNGIKFQDLNRGLVLKALDFLKV